MAEGARASRAAAPTRESGRDTATPQHVIEAAIQCVLERGFYRTSSNAIAERAGVSWGVIQYHFGSRENLMLAVLEEGTRRLNETLRGARITGKTVTDRIAEYQEVLVSYYGSADYLVFTQVLLNLSHDPQTSQQAHDTMTRISDAADPELRRLVGQVLAGTGIRRPAVRSTLFHALRGMAVSQLMLQTLPDRGKAARRLAEERRLLAEALGSMVRDQGK